MIADCIYAHLCIFYYSKVHAAFQGVLSPLAKFFCGRCEKGTPSREQSHGAYNVIRRSAATAQRRISYHTRSDMCNSCCQSCCGCQGSLASALANLFDTGCDCSCNNFSCCNSGRNRSSGNCGCNNASAISNGNRSGRAAGIPAIPATAGTARAAGIPAIPATAGTARAADAPTAALV